MKNVGSFILTRFVDANRYQERLDTFSKNASAGEITASG
jgi:hypothetical protein